MSATKVPRFGPIVRLIGYLIVIPSLLGVAFAFLICAGVTAVTPEMMADAKTATEQSDTVLASGLGYGFSIFMGAGALVSGLIGWLLLGKRKVFLCARCGYVLDRA